MIDNRETMAKNLRRLMSDKGVNATDVCTALGFKHNTFSDWVNGKTYPRIDKIELMARYFNVLKSELVEEPINLDSEEINSAFTQNAINFYTKYLSADKKTRKMIDMLLEEGE